MFYLYSLRGKLTKKKITASLDYKKKRKQKQQPKKPLCIPEFYMENLIINDYVSVQ